MVTSSICLLCALLRGGRGGAMGGLDVKYGWYCGMDESARARIELYE